MRTDGFTLIELLTVVGIIGTLGAIAAPAYKGYVARAQVSEAMRILAAAKIPLTEYYIQNGAWPPSMADVADLSGATVTDIAITLGAGSPDPETTVAVTLRTGSISRDLQGRMLSLTTTDGGIHWVCRSNVSSHLLPTACRDIGTPG